MQVYKFRNCLLNTVERRVIKDGEYLKLTPRTFDVLLLLVESQSRIVSKDEMLGKVWNGRFVEEGNLSVQIKKLRTELVETWTERYIETVHGYGYRFVAEVKEVHIDVWKQTLLNFRPIENRGISPIPRSRLQKESYSSAYHSKAA